MVKISLIMAAYNAEQYIKDAICSVLDQTYKNWELIIVDDGSSDRTAEIIDDFSKKDVRIQVIHQKNSGTAASARNTALKYITGDYVHMLDADDMIENDLLENYYHKLSKGKFDILIPNCRLFRNNDINDAVWEKKAPGNDYNLCITGETGFELSLDWTIHGIFLIKAEIILNMKYDSKLINGDEFTTRKLLYNASQIGFVNSYYYYRENDNSTTRKNANMYRMFECLLTDINIYNYSISKKMPQTLKNKCISKIVKSFWGYSRLYSKLQKEKVVGNEQERALQILQKTYYTLTKEMWKEVEFKYRFFFYLSNGKFDKFQKIMKTISAL